MKFHSTRSGDENLHGNLSAILKGETFQLPIDLGDLLDVKQIKWFVKFQLLKTKQLSLLLRKEPVKQRDLQAIDADEKDMEKAERIYFCSGNSSNEATTTLLNGKSPCSFFLTKKAFLQVHSLSSQTLDSPSFNDSSLFHVPLTTYWFVKLLVNQLRVNLLRVKLEKVI